MTHDFGEQRMEATVYRGDTYKLELLNASGDLLHTSLYTSNKKGAPGEWDEAQWNSLLDTMNQARQTI